MKIIFMSCLLILASMNSMAGSYDEYKKQVRNQLVGCLKDPENSRFVAAYNGCLLEAADNFISKADIEYKSAFQKANDFEKRNLLKNRNIYTNAFSNCEIYQELSYDGFGKEAYCKITVAKEYLGSLTNSADSLPENWTTENRVDKYFIGY